MFFTKKQEDQSLEKHQHRNFHYNWIPWHKEKVSFLALGKKKSMNKEKIRAELYGVKVYGIERASVLYQNTNLNNQN